MKIFTLYFLALMLAFSPVYAKVKTLPPPGNIIPFGEVDSQMIGEIIAGMHPDLVVECPKGTELPISFLHNTVFFSLLCSPNLLIKVEKTCYLRFIKKKVYMSENTTQWDKPSKFLEGRYAAGLKIDKKPGLKVETNVTPYSSLEDRFGD